LRLPDLVADQDWERREMKCFWCLVALQNGEQTVVQDADYIYQGTTACMRHLNVVRGHDPDMDRNPEDPKEE
jgi:hypothetical protein